MPWVWAGTPQPWTSSAPRAGPSNSAGGYRGRKPSLSPEKAAELSRRAQAGEKKACLAHEFGITRQTLYHDLRQKPGDVAPDGSPQPDGRKSTDFAQ